MHIPNGFVPSDLQRYRVHDQEGRLVEFRIDSSITSSDDGGIAEANSLYATRAEMFGSIAPFLKRNRARDVTRRNYVIRPGGEAVYEIDRPDIRFNFPSEQESMGHNSLNGSKLT